MKMKKVVKMVLMGTLAGSLLLTGCGGIKDDATLVSIDGGKETISLGYGNFVARYSQSLYDATYLNYFGTELWTQEQDGKTFEETVKEGILTTLEDEYLLVLHAKDYDVSLTEEEAKAAEKAADQFLKDNDADTLDTMSASRENVVKFMKQAVISSRVEDVIRAEAEVAVTDEEAAQRTFTYAFVNSQTITDADGHSTELTDEDRESLKAQMKTLAAASDLEASAKILGITTQTYSYGADEDSMDEAVIAAADKLLEGQTSDVITVEDKGFYVIRLDSEYDDEATANKKVSIEKEKREAYLQSVLDGWKKDLDWKVDEEQWAKVKFDSFFKMVGEEAE